MPAKTFFKHIAKLSFVRVLKCHEYSMSKGLTKTSTLPHITNGINSYNFIKQYCSTVYNIPIVSYEEVKELPKRPDVLLIDVREPYELEETGKIPTSVNIPLGQVADELGPNLDNDAFKAKYGRKKPEETTEIIFHCKIGKRSQNAAELARSLGFQNAKNYLGSWTEWAEKEGLQK